MKNIVQTTLLTLALLVPTTSFAMYFCPDETEEERLDEEYRIEQHISQERQEKILAVLASDDVAHNHTSGIASFLQVEDWAALEATSRSCRRGALQRKIEIIANKLTTRDNTPLLLSPEVRLAIAKHIVATPSRQQNTSGNYPLALTEVESITTLRPIDTLSYQTGVPAHIALDTPMLIFRILLARFPDLCRTANRNGETLLHLACEGSRPYWVKLFLAYGARNVINTIDRFGETPMHKICKHFSNFNTKDMSVVKLLLAHGATTTWRQKRYIFKYVLKMLSTNPAMKQILYYQDEIAAGLGIAVGAGLSYCLSPE